MISKDMDDLVLKRIMKGMSIQDLSRLWVITHRQIVLNRLFKYLSILDITRIPHESIPDLIQMKRKLISHAEHEIQLLARRQIRLEQQSQIIIPFENFLRLRYWRPIDLSGITDVNDLRSIVTECPHCYLIDGEENLDECDSVGVYMGAMKGVFELTDFSILSI